MPLTYSPDADSHALIAMLVRDLESVRDADGTPYQARRIASVAVEAARKELRPSDGWERCECCGGACVAGVATTALRSKRELQPC